jgi:hypothetical protein
MGDLMMTAAPIDTQAEASTKSPGRWGPWETAGLGLLLVFVHNFFMSATIAALGYNRLARRSGGELEQPATGELLERLATDGVAGSIAAVVASIFCVGAILAITRMRTSDHQEYLAMRKSALFPTVGWVGVVVLLQLAWQTAAQYGYGPEYSQYTVDVYATGAGHPVMWIAYLLLIPAFEELFARGFLFAGWQRSGLGSAGAVFATTVFWTTIHFQHTPIELAQVATAGVVLGCARVHTRSIYPPLVMHAVVNFMALWLASNYII